MVGMRPMRLFRRRPPIIGLAHAVGGGLAALLLVTASANAGDSFDYEPRWACELLGSLEPPASGTRGNDAPSAIVVAERYSDLAAGHHNQFSFFWQALEAVWAEFPPAARRSGTPPVRTFRPLIQAAWEASQDTSEIPCDGPEIVRGNTAEAMRARRQRLNDHAVRASLPPDHPANLAPVRTGPCGPVGLQTAPVPITVSQPVFDEFGQTAALFVNGTMTVFERRASRWTILYSLPHNMAVC